MTAYDAVRWRQNVLSRRFAPWLRRQTSDRLVPAALTVYARCEAKTARHAIAVHDAGYLRWDSQPLR